MLMVKPFDDTCVRCGRTATNTREHIEQYHKDEFEQWKVKHGYDKLYETIRKLERVEKALEEYGFTVEESN